MPRFALRLLGLAAGCGLLWVEAGVAWAEGETQTAAMVEFGRQIFEHNFSRPESWKGGRPLGDGGDGLGPQFNDVSCVACHKQGGAGGGGPLAKNIRILSFRPANGLQRGQIEAVVREASKMHPEFSTRLASSPLHSFRIPQAEDRQPYEEFLAELFNRLELPVDQAAPQRKVIGNATFEISQRNTSALWGAGAIDEFRRQEGNGIRRHFIDEQNAKYPWLSGRIPRDARQQESWFGWRGQLATLHDFNLGACATEMGLTVPGVTQHPSAVDGLAEVPHRLDLTSEEATSLTAFVASLPAPEQALPAEAAAAERVQFGEQVFNTCHCNACHTRDLEMLRGIFSDLALHDMGVELCDLSEAIPEILAGEIVSIGFTESRYYGPPTDLISPPKVNPTNCECEWRTPPLWGCADSAPYLHDGRASTLDEAIRLHGGESTTSRHAYELLTPAERSALLAFLETLRAPQSASQPGGDVRLTAITTPMTAASSDGPAAEVASLPAVDNPGVEAAALPALPIATPVTVEADAQAIAALRELLTELKPTAASQARSTAIHASISRSLPESGSADYALSLFQKRSLQHRAALTTSESIASGQGIYAARARLVVALDQVRQREYGAALLQLQNGCARLAQDSSLADQDAAEQAELLGVVLAWFRGPSGIDPSRFQPGLALDRARGMLPNRLQTSFDAGVARVEAQVVALQTERDALVALESAQQANQAAELAERRASLQQQKTSLESSHEEAKSKLAETLAKLDPQLNDLEKQYAEKDGTDQRLASQIAPLELQLDALTLQAAQAPVGDNGRWTTRSGPPRQLRTVLQDEMNAANIRLGVLYQLREENQTQARLIVIKAQQLSEQRAAAVSDFSQQTGQAVKQLDSLNKWHARYAKESERLGEATADKSKRVKQIERSIKELNTYYRHDINAEAQWMLTRYRAPE